MRLAYSHIDWHDAGALAIRRSSEIHAHLQCVKPHSQH